MAIRRVRADEWDAYREVRLRALLDAPTAFGTSHADAAARPVEWWQGRTRTLAASATDALFVDDDAGRFSGLFGAVIEEPGATLISMWVDPAKRGTGAGEALMEATRGWAVERGACTVELWVTDGNAHAIALYERCGFVFTGATQPHPSQPDLRELAMRCGVAT